jgi:hypothetical protein
MFRPKEIKIPCGSCGHENELGRIFCARCGTKLDIQSLRPHKQDPEKRGKKRLTPKQIIKRAAILLIIAGVVGFFVALFCVPADVTGASDVAGNAQKLREQLIAMSRAQDRGQPAAATVQQADINAHFATFEWPKLRGQRWEASVHRARIELRDGNVIFHAVLDISWAKFHKNFYIQFVGRPKLEQEMFFCEPMGGRVGALPVPRALLNAKILRALAQLFRSFVDEQHVLDRLTSVEILDGTAVLQYKGR